MVDPQVIEATESKNPDEMGPRYNYCKISAVYFHVDNPAFETYLGLELPSFFFVSLKY